jgi:hypothetical protein
MTTGSFPLGRAMRNTPVMVTGVPVGSPFRNCSSEIVSEGIGSSSVRGTSCFTEASCARATGA